jgi:hypothetical protein
VPRLGDIRTAVKLRCATIQLGHGMVGLVGERQTDRSDDDGCLMLGRWSSRPSREVAPHRAAAGAELHWSDLVLPGRVLYRRSIATVTLLPERYVRTGRMTPRLFEAVFARCLPLVPTGICDARRFAEPI